MPATLTPTPPPQKRDRVSPVRGSTSAPSAPDLLSIPDPRYSKTSPDSPQQPAPVPPLPTPNALTIDLEDWPIAVLGPHHDITSRVVENTRRCLNILRWHGVTATFFVLTKVAEKYPALIEEVHRDGHEIASHGHGHELLTNLTPNRFRADLEKSRQVLVDLIGRPPLGYRAPAFSIVRATRWAAPILAEMGFEYSSSVFPIRHPRYGIPDAPCGLHRWPGSDLVECPPATVRAFGRNWPVAGGGYFRLLPGVVARTAIRRINQTGSPAILYMHPYELDLNGVAQHQADGIRVSRRLRIHQSLFRGRFETRLHRLLESFAFKPLVEHVQAWRACH